MKIYYIHTDCLLISAQHLEKFKNRVSEDLGCLKIEASGDFEVKEHPVRCKLIEK
jgi:hypothetical protein